MKAEDVTIGWHWLKDETDPVLVYHVEDPNVLYHHMRFTDDGTLQVVDGLAAASLLVGPCNPPGHRVISYSRLPHPNPSQAVAANRSAIRNAILRAIAIYTDTHLGLNPSIWDLKDLTDLSTSVLKHHIARLEEEGLVTWPRVPGSRQRAARGIALTPAARPV